MRVVAIVNPISGAGMDPTAADRRVAMIRDELRRRDLQVAIHLTERSNHAWQLASQAAADRADLVIVWGGDGTVNEVGRGLMGTSTVLALIPAGSGNGLAAALAVPRDVHAAIAVALGDRTVAADVGMMNDRPFFNVAGVGFDAHIARLFNERARGRRGRLPYVLIGVREGCRYVGQHYRVRLDRESYVTHALLIAFANGREYGMGMRIAPGALLDDGILEACIVEDRPVLARIKDSRHLLLGSIHRAPRMMRKPVRTATIEADTPIEFHVDGEPAGAARRLQVSVRPGAIKIKCGGVG